MKRAPKICVVSFFTYNYAPLVCLVQILQKLSDDIIVISGDFPVQSLAHNVRLVNYRYDRKSQPLPFRALKYILTQLKITYHLVTRARGADIVLFFIGGAGLLFPVITAKLLGKRTAQVIVGSGSRSARDTYRKYLFGAGGFIISGILSMIENITFSLSDRIVTFTKNSGHDLKLDRYNRKLITEGALFIDTVQFRILTGLPERKDAVGYAGRLSPEKGIMGLVRAIPLVWAKSANIGYIILGDGPLRQQIERVIVGQSYQDKVTLNGWTPAEEMPKALNQIKLLVLPSHTESLPFALLEAMACGTPVLATPVGSIPDLITDGETGFLLADNSAESIARGILKALIHPDLSTIVRNARQLIERNYTYEMAVRRYEAILNSILGER